MKNVRLRKTLAGPEGTWHEGTEMQMGDDAAKNLETLGAVEILGDVAPIETLVFAPDDGGDPEDGDPDDEFTSEVTAEGEMETAEATPATATPDAPQGRTRTRK